MNRERIDHPAHYGSRGGMECIEAIEAMVGVMPGEAAFAMGNALKYIWRYNGKGGAEDLRKAIWYIQREIDRLEGC